MITKKIVFIFLASMLTKLLPAQSSDPSLISSGGDLGQAGSLTLSYSIGEPCISSSQVDVHWITEGFQQPGKINLTSIEVNNQNEYSFIVFPNPASSELHIESTVLTSEQLIQITNVLGQAMLTNPIPAEQSMIVPLNHLKPGFYFLVIHDHTSIAFTQPFIKL